MGEEDFPMGLEYLVQNSMKLSHPTKERPFFPSGCVNREEWVLRVKFDPVNRPIIKFTFRMRQHLWIQ